MTDTFPLGPTIGGESWREEGEGWYPARVLASEARRSRFHPTSPIPPGSDIIVEPRLIPLIPTRGNSGRGRPFHMF